MVSVAPRTPGWAVAMGTPRKTIRPVKASDLLQKNPAGIDCLEKSAKVVPSPGVRQRSIPLVMARSAARTGTARRMAKQTIARTESFFMSFSWIAAFELEQEGNVLLAWAW